MGEIALVCRPGDIFIDWTRQRHRAEFVVMLACRSAGALEYDLVSLGTLPTLEPRSVNFPVALQARNVPDRCYQDGHGQQETFDWARH